jgi:hypothetical protein
MKPILEFRTTKQTSEWNDFLLLSMSEKRHLIEEIALDVRKKFEGAQFAYTTHRYGWRCGYGIFLAGPLRLTESRRIKATKDAVTLLGELHTYVDTSTKNGSVNDDLNVEFACWSQVLSHYCLRRSVHPNDALNNNGY